VNRRILIDTCGVVKWADGSMPASAQEILLSAERRYVSVISAWEIQLKPELRCRISPADFGTLVDAMHLDVVPLQLNYIRALAALHDVPNLPHKDPFDHILIAQAALMDWSILTCDERFKAYPKIEVLW
jgi:PIN domain nuclease of toxin-antitoxin system